MSSPKTNDESKTPSGIVKPPAFANKPMSPEERILDRLDKMSERINKLERSQFDSNKTERELRDFKKTVDKSFAKESKSYINLKARVDGLESDLANIEEDRVGGPRVGDLATAPSAQSWEASKQAAKLVHARIRAAVQAEIHKQDEDFKVEDIPSSPPVQGSAKAPSRPTATDITPARDTAGKIASTSPEDEQTSTKAKPRKRIGSGASTQDDDIMMDEEQGMVIRDSQQNAQKVDFIPSREDQLSQESLGTAIRDSQQNAQKVDFIPSLEDQLSQESLD